jgi:serine/threonine protein kinase
MLTRFVSSPEGKAGAEKKNALRRFKRADLEVSDKIGKGAYGGVWQATVLDTKQEVVVKVMWPDADLDPEDAKNESPGQHRKDAFKREIEMMRRVGSHPNIIAVLGATADSTVIVFEEALTDLHVIIKKQKRSLSLPIIRRCTRDILKGVEYLHEIKVAHRDLKPANILVFKDMTCKLGDFGLAREFGDNQEMTVKNEVSTLWYRAPELLMGFATYLPIIDEWSTGCILLEMLTGRCSLMGRVEDVCDCPQPTHFNYNSDQLLKIFHLVGSAAGTQFVLLTSKVRICTFVLVKRV